MGKAIVINSGKGGVGKSTLCVALGATLAKRRNRVLMIDCDAGLRTLDKMTGSEEKLLFDLFDVSRGRCTPAQAINYCQNLTYLMAAPLKAANMPSVAFMKRLVNMLKGHFDYVFLDCAAGLGEEFISASSCADSALIVCTPDPVSVRAGANTCIALDKLGIKDRSLIINRFNHRLFDKIDEIDDLDKVIDEVGVKIIGLVPEDTNFASSILCAKQPQSKSIAMIEIEKIASRISGDYIPIT